LAIVVLPKAVDRHNAHGRQIDPVQTAWGVAFDVALGLCCMRDRYLPFDHLGIQHRSFQSDGRQSGFPSARSVKSSFWYLPYVLQSWDMACESSLHTPWTPRTRSRY